MCCAPSGGDGSAVPYDISLTAWVESSDITLRVTNRDTFPWTGCEVSVNSGIVRSGFSQKVGLIAAGDMRQWPLADFTRPSGERFNPLTTVVTDAFLACDTDQGRGYHSGGF